MSDIAIETLHLRKEYGSKVAVKDLCLQVKAGEIFGFLGPNGAGKSTTMNMLLNLVEPTDGQVAVFGRSPSVPQTRAKMGFLPEHFRFHEWLGATEFLFIHGRLYGMERDLLRQRIPYLLDLVGLSHSAEKKLSQFSKGMLQRIGLAQAMLNSPDIILLDEPTSGLDPLGRRLVRDIVRELKANGTTVFINSHFLSEVEVTCDRVAFIKDGQVVRTETVDRLLQDITEVTLRVDRVDPTLLAALREISQSIKVDGCQLSVAVGDVEMVPLIARRAIENGAKIYDLHPRRRTLEDIFLDVIGLVPEID